MGKRKGLAAPCVLGELFTDGPCGPHRGNGSSRWSDEVTQRRHDAADAGRSSAGRCDCLVEGSPLVTQSSENRRFRRAPLTVTQICSQAIDQDEQEIVRHRLVANQAKRATIPLQADEAGPKVARVRSIGGPHSIRHLNERQQLYCNLPAKRVRPGGLGAHSLEILSDLGS
jgi:hypothetical protein